MNANLTRSFLFLATAVAVFAAVADDCTWTGLGDTTAWSDAGNWSKTPAAGDRAVFPSALEAKTVRFVGTDRTTFGLFAQVAIEEGIELLYDGTDTLTLTNKLQGAGAFCAIWNGGVYLRKCDNRDFTGDFYFTNKNVTVQSETYIFGKTNRVFFTSSGQSYRLTFPDSRTYPAQGVFSNEFHFVSTAGYRQSITRNDRLPDGIDFNGSVYLTGRGMFSVGAKTAYGYHFHGGVYGTGLLMTDGNSDADNPNFYVDGKGGDVGGITTYQGTIGIKAPIKTPYFDGGSPTSGIKFFCENGSGAAAEWSFDRMREYDNGAVFNLGGYNQKCGHIRTCFYKATGEAKNIIKSATPATLTCTGLSLDPGYWTQFRGRLMGAVTFVYDNNPNLPKPSGTSGTAGTFNFKGAGSDTTGGLIASNGTLAVGATATFSNLTYLAAVNTGVLKVSTSDIGNGGTGLAVRVAD